MTGRKRYVARTVRGGKRDAQRALVSLAHEVNERSETRARATVGDLLEAWFDHARDDLSPIATSPVSADAFWPCSPVVLPMPANALTHHRRATRVMLLTDGPPGP
jgi:hypothetical protein